MHSHSRATSSSLRLTNAKFDHGEFLEGVKDRVPEAVTSPVDRAQIASEQGRATVEALSADEIPGDQTEGVPGSALDLIPDASSDYAPSLGPLRTPPQPLDKTSTGLPEVTISGLPDLTPEPFPSIIPPAGG